MDRDTEQFTFSPWHIYTCVFIAFWACSAFGDSFLITTGLCILFGFISDSLNKYMVGGNEIETQDRTQEEHQFGLLDDAPTKPLPPEPEDVDDDSDTEEDKGNNTMHQFEAEEKHKEFEKHISKADENLAAEILEPLDEYDKHPMPESVEFVDPDRCIDRRVLMSKDDDQVIHPLEQEERSNDGDNTSPSQDSFQMLDMGSDSEVSKPIPDELFVTSKAAINSSDVGGVEEILNLGRGFSADNIIEEIPQTSAEPVVQFTDNSDVDFHSEEETALVDAPDDEKLRQTSKDFVDDLMEEAINITSEQHVQSQDDAEHVTKYNQASRVDTASPGDLMAELLGSVPPPSTSPPEILLDTEEKCPEGAKLESGEELDNIGSFTTSSKEKEEDEEELEKLLRDAQKDEHGKSNNHDANENGIVSDDAKGLDEMVREKDTKLEQDIRKDSSSDYEEESPKNTQVIPVIRKDSSSDYDEEPQDGAEEETDDVGELVPEEKSKRNKLKKRDSSSDYEEGNDNDNVDEDKNSDSDLELEVDIKTKTLADMDEGDPWATKSVGKDNDNVSSLEDSEKPNTGGFLLHVDSDDFPAQDDMSHRAVFGDDDDRNDDDVLLEEDEEEAEVREDENRKLSTTIPSLMEENAALDMQHKPEESVNVSKQAEGDEPKVIPGASTVLSSDSSYIQEVETALEAKEVPVISDNASSNEKDSQIQSDISGEVLSSAAVSVNSSEVKMDTTDDNMSASTNIVEEDKPLVEF